MSAGGWSTVCDAGLTLPAHWLPTERLAFAEPTLVFNVFMYVYYVCYNIFDNKYGNTLSGEVLN